jgi:hypothetical protein
LYLGKPLISLQVGFSGPKPYTKPNQEIIAQERSRSHQRLGKDRPADDEIGGADIKLILKLIQINCFSSENLY